NKDPEVRRSTAEALRRIGSAAVPALEEAIRNKDPEVRSAAAEALGEIGPAAKDAVPALRKALEDPDRTVREHAQQALKRINWAPSPSRAGAEPPQDDRLPPRDVIQGRAHHAPRPRLTAGHPSGQNVSMSHDAYALSDAPRLREGLEAYRDDPRFTVLVDPL